MRDDGPRIDPQTGRPPNENEPVLGAICGFLSIGFGLLGLIVCCLPVSGMSAPLALLLGGIALYLQGTPGRVAGGFGVFLGFSSVALMALYYGSVILSAPQWDEEHRKQELREEVEKAFVEAIEDLKTKAIDSEEIRSPPAESLDRHASPQAAPAEPNPSVPSEVDSKPGGS